MVLVAETRLARNVHDSLTIFIDGHAWAFGCNLCDRIGRYLGGGSPGIVRQNLEGGGLLWLTLFSFSYQLLQALFVLALGTDLA